MLLMKRQRTTGRRIRREVKFNGDHDSQTTERKAPGKSNAELAMEKAKAYARQKAKSRAMGYTILLRKEKKSILTPGSGR